jgi:uncharacterized protein YkwD
VTPEASAPPGITVPSLGDPATRSAIGCAGAPPLAVDEALEQEVLGLVNAERRSRGLAPLRASASLGDAARLHAREMADGDYFEHDSLERTSRGLAKACDWAERVRRFAPEAHHVAENLAAGAETASEVVSGWMTSPGHRKNILDPGFREAGVGYWPGGREGYYWVADFGSR